MISVRNRDKFSTVQRKQIGHWKKKIKTIQLYKKLEILDYAAKGHTNEQISDLTDYSVRRICALINEYLKNGIGYFLQEHRKGGNRRNLTDAQEAIIIETFEDRAKKGKIVHLCHIKEKYEKVRGKETANSTFYDFMNRMKWRQVMPRGQHPKKASEEVMETSKKLTK